LLKHKVSGYFSLMGKFDKAGRMMMKTKYEIILFWSEEDQAYLAEVPELPGCMADGKTPQKALANAKKIIAEWILTAKELGRTIPEPRGRLAYA
jgi:predicted RNase H-like HicB family nuclease